MKIQELPKNIISKFRSGTVIPAQPLALNKNRKLDPKRIRALVRYYIDAGVGGMAVGVHTTQFEIREPGIDLFKPVLQMVSETMDAYSLKQGKSIIKIAGVCGNTAQAVKEATFAGRAGYHACLLSLASLAKENVDTLVQHCRAVAEVMPVVGFYLQPSVGGRILPYSFWRKFAEIENILGIKIAPFNRYQTFDVVRAICEAGREKEITLYTGNDDHIILDLLSEIRVATSHGLKKIRIVGGLLGHWAVWTKKAVELLSEVHQITNSGNAIPAEMLSRAIEVTDTNAAFFDSANSFHGCIPGIHEVLKRQGLLEGTWCLDPKLDLSPGQKEEIDRIYRSYPNLNDDDFVKQNLDQWLAG